MSDQHFRSLQKTYLSILDQCHLYAGTWIEGYYKSVLGNLYMKITTEFADRQKEEADGQGN